MEGRASWSEDKDRTWMKELIHQVHVLGKRSDSGYKREAWVAAVAKLNEEHHISYNRDQVKARHTELKKQYAQMTQIIKTSGVGFESATCRPVCTEGSWAHFLRDKPKQWTVWQTKRFPLYPLCQQLFDGTLATGEYASSASDLPSRNNNDISDFDSVEGGEELIEETNIDDDETSDGDDTDTRESRRRRSALPLGSGSSKRTRTSLASAMVAEMKAFRASGREEIELIREVIARSPTLTSGSRASLERSYPALAIDALHEHFDAILEDKELAFAYDVFENEEKAAQFIRMKGLAREVWLRRQIAQKEREYLRESSE
ncbi:hypothetical protein AeRB84_004094 [Aphanomyces euteiches]|nr:hypothetical protein AeRB84_004094 [Aphanomyces euteiches]